MKVINFSLYLVVYNFVIAVLVMVASEKLGVFAGRLAGSRRAQAARLTRTATFTFGACVATISTGVYLAFYVLKV